MMYRMQRDAFYRRDLNIGEFGTLWSPGANPQGHQVPIMASPQQAAEVT